MVALLKVHDVRKQSPIISILGFDSFVNPKTPSNVKIGVGSIFYGFQYTEDEAKDKLGGH